MLTAHCEGSRLSWLAGGSESTSSSPSESEVAALDGRSSVLRSSKEERDCVERLNAPCSETRKDAVHGQQTDYPVITMAGRAETRSRGWSSPIEARLLCTPGTWYRSSAPPGLPSSSQSSDPLSDSASGLLVKGVEDGVGAAKVGGTTENPLRLTVDHQCFMMRIYEGVSEV